MAKKLNRKKSFATIIGKVPGAPGAVYSQGYFYYDQNDNLCGEKERPKAKASAANPTADEQREKTLERATAILGDLGPVDSQAQARKENAAVVQAESFADDV